eukprot:6521630-Prorocentrum_lima.AAC.1
MVRSRRWRPRRRRLRPQPRTLWQTGMRGRSAPPRSGRRTALCARGWWQAPRGVRIAVVAVETPGLGL